MDFIVTLINCVTYKDVSHFSKSKHIWSFRVSNRRSCKTTFCTKIDMSANATAIIQRIKVIQVYIRAYHIQLY